MEGKVSTSRKLVEIKLAEKDTVRYLRGSFFP